MNKYISSLIHYSATATTVRLRDEILIIVSSRLSKTRKILCFHNWQAFVPAASVLNMVNKVSD